jgi:hypothetical protein
MNKADTFAQLREVAPQIKSEHGFTLLLDEEQGLISIQNESEVIATARHLSNEGKITAFELQGSHSLQNITLTKYFQDFLGESKGYLEKSEEAPEKAVQRFCKFTRAISKQVVSMVDLSKSLPNTKWELDIDRRGDIQLYMSLKTEKELNSPIIVPTVVVSSHIVPMDAFSSHLEKGIVFFRTGFSYQSKHKFDNHCFSTTQDTVDSITQKIAVRKNVQQLTSGLLATHSEQILDALKLRKNPEKKCPSLVTVTLSNFQNITLSAEGAHTLVLNEQSTWNLPLYEGLRSVKNQIPQYTIYQLGLNIK